jgi:hypothetical protein
MRLALCLLAAAAAIGPLGCGGNDDSAGTTSETTPTHPVQAPAPAGTKTAGRPSGSTHGSGGAGASGSAHADSGAGANPDRSRNPSVFVEAARVCAVGPPAKVAQNLGIKSTDARSIARALAKGYKPKFRNAAYRGCLTALK